MQAKLDVQAEHIKQVEEELKDEKIKRLSLETTIESFKGKSVQLDSHEILIQSLKKAVGEIVENVTDITKAIANLAATAVSADLCKEEVRALKTSMSQFSYSIKSAFRAEKSLLRNLSQTIKDDTFKQLFENEFETLVNTTSDSIDTIKSDITNLKFKTDEVVESVKTVGDSLDKRIKKLNSTVALTDEQVDANEKLLRTFAGCCSGKSMSPFIAVLKLRTPKFQTKWDMQTAQIQIRLLLKIYTVFNSAKHFKK